MGERAASIYEGESNMGLLFLRLNLIPAQLEKFQLPHKETEPCASVSQSMHGFDG